MIGTALTLATLTTGGFLAIYLKLPPNIRKLIKKHALATDLATLGLAYVLLGGTLTALMAASMSGLFVSVLLFLAKNRKVDKYGNVHHLAY